MYTDKTKLNLIYIVYTSKFNIYSCIPIYCTCKIYFFFVFLVFFAFLHLFASFCRTFFGSSGTLILPSLFVASCFCVLMHFCILFLVDSCFPPFQKSVATFVYCRFFLSLLYSVLILCSARITSAGLSKLLDLRSTTLLATSLFFSTPINRKWKKNKYCVPYVGTIQT